MAASFFRMGLVTATVCLAVSSQAAAVSFCGTAADLKFAGKDPREGIYTGEWRGIGHSSRLCSALAIESFNSDGTATVVYFWGTEPGWGVRTPGNRRYNWNASDDTLSSANPQVEFKMKGDVLEGKFGGSTPGNFRKQK